MADTIRVSPTEKRPTHDISLTDGTTTLGLILCNGKGEPDRRSIRGSNMPRTALQIRQGDTDYSDYELPYTPQTQKDWTGGRGQLDIEGDKSRYLDSFGVNTLHGGIMLAPKRTLSYGRDFTWLGDDLWVNLYGTAKYIAFLVSVSADMVGLWNHFSGMVIGELDYTGDPGKIIFQVRDFATYAVLHEYQFDKTEGTDVKLLMSPFDLAAGNYLFTLTSETPSPTSYYSIRARNYPTPNNIISADATTWTSGGNWEANLNTLLPFYLESANFFEYKAQLYAVSNPRFGISQVYMNGYRGAALSNAGDLTKTKTSLTISEDLTGKIIYIFNGPGSEEPQPWRRISSNTTGSNAILTVSPSWEIEHTTATEFVIKGTDTWSWVANCKGKVNNVAVTAETVYFAEGESVTIEKFRWAYITGVWTHQIADDGANKASFIKVLRATTGKYKIWKVNQGSGTTPPRAFYSDVKAWADSLVFQTTGIDLGDASSRVTGTAIYGTPQQMWILKEDEFGSIQDDVYGPVPIGELRAARSEVNGKAALQWGVYLYLSFLDGIERYYENRLDDIGPNRDEGLPRDRKGVCADMVTYPGMLIAAISPTYENEDWDYASSILVNNQVGWHEIARSNEPIAHLYVQAMPGDRPDILWVSTTDNICRLPLALNPRQYKNITGESRDVYEFESTGYLISSWFKVSSFQTIAKFWRSVQAYWETAAGTTGSSSISFEYQLDSDTDSSAWRTMETPTATSPVYETLLDDEYKITGKRWRYKITLTQGTGTGTPWVRAVTVEAVLRQPVKNSYTITFIVDDNASSLQTTRLTTSATTIAAQLATWANVNTQAAPVYLRSVLPEFDSKYVFVEPATVVPVEVVTANGQRQRKYIGTMTVVEA